MSKLDKITAEPPTSPAPIAGKSVMLVLDTTARDGIRTHEQIVQGVIKSFTFEPGKGLAMPIAIAMKFLRHDAFKLVDEAGTILEWQRRPKQLHELGAGEQLKLADNETIARIDELSNTSLLRRALEMPNGEEFNLKSEREVMIDFIVKTTIAQNKARAARPENGPDEFTPAAEEHDEEMAA